MTPLIERVMVRLDTTDPTACWIWPGATNGLGYGRVGRGRRGEGNAMTHRVTYEHVVGPIPAGYEIDHRCRVRACCNPAHMDAVTPAENARRASADGMRDRTHCRRGHPYNAENTGRQVTGVGRRCKACRRDRDAAKNIHAAMSGYMGSAS